MSVPNKTKANNWSSLMKDQITGIASSISGLKEDQDIPIVVRPPEPHPSVKQKPKQKDSISLYLSRKRYRIVQKTIDLEKPAKPLIDVDSQKATINHSASSKPIIQILPQKKKKEEPEVAEVIDLDGRNQKPKIQKPKNSVHISQKPIKASVSSNNTSNSRITKQLLAIEQMNEPEWVKNKNKRRAINQHKYPNSYNYSHEFTDFSRTERFTGMNRASDRHWKSYLEKQEQNKEKNKQKKQIQRQQKQLQAEKKKKKAEQRSAGQIAVLEGLINASPKKKVKPNQQLKPHQQQKPDEQDQELGNKQVLNVIMADDDQQNVDEVKEVPKRNRIRVGAKDKIQFQTSAPNFINMILQHSYAEEAMKFQTKRIPDYFDDVQTYRKTFHYLISGECIAEMRHKLRTIQKTDQQSLKVVIKQVKTDVDGQVEISLSQKQLKQIGGIQLKNYSLSKNRIGLICSSRQYRKQYYGVSNKNTKEFAFLVLLITPTTNDELNKQVRAKAKIKAGDLEQLMAIRKSRSAHFFDMQKLSTNLREYLAVSNIKCSDLASSILDPSQVVEEEGRFVQNQELLNDILDILKKTFNDTQWLSIREMVFRQRGFVLLQGPPGTGKTSTLMGLLAAQYEYLRKTQDKRKIMICAPSNAAVDHIAKRIVTQGLISGEGEIIHPNILRTGIVDTMDQDVRSVSLDEQCQKIMLANKQQAEKFNNLSTPQIKQKVIQVQKQIRNLSNKNKQNELAAKKQQLIEYQKLLFNLKTYKYITSKANYTNIENKLFKDAEIVLTTLASSGNDKIDKIRGEIACLIVDQAAQATQPNLLIALQTGVQKVLLIGDPYQLPATCISNDSNITLFNRSLFERFLDANVSPYFLNIQYRMSPIVRSFPSSRFYHDRLIDAKAVLQRPIPTFLKNFQGRNVLFIDLKYGRDQRKGDSYWNDAEARVISLLIRCLMDKSVTLGLITPYQSQKRAIFRECMQALKENQADQQHLQKEIMINTVDSFQGQEKDIIIVSTVRANSTYNVGFLTDERRINVTLTRAKHLLVVIGHADTLGSNEVWDDFLTWTENIKCYYQIRSQRHMQEVIGTVFQEMNFEKIRRKKHSKLSTDVRNLYRNQIQSVDFQSKKEADYQKLLNQKDKRENPVSVNEQNRKSPYERQEKTATSNKYAMNIEESQKILEEKRKKQEEEKNFQLVLGRLREAQREHGDEFK